MDQIPISALLIAFVILLIIAGFFSIAETSMIALNRYRLKHLARHGHKGAKRAAQLLAQTDRMLGVILIGNNFANAASATLVTVITGRLFGVSELSLTIATLVVTFFILIFSEITPKVVGAAYPERIAFPSTFILIPLLRFFAPAVWFVNLFVKGLLRLLRLNHKAEGQSQPLNIEEVRTILLEAAHIIPRKHHSVLLNLLELEKINVDDIMTPRSHIEAIDIQAPIGDILSQISTSYHTRLPVYTNQLDKIVGVVHVRRVLHKMQTDELSHENIKEIMEEPYFIPSATPLLSQLQHFQENQKRIGLVVDEYGELQGLVSLEDILEEIVGEFTTQSPTQSNIYLKQEDDGSWLVDAGSLLRELNRKLKLQFPLNGPKTLNGIILEQFEDIPEAGTSLKIKDYTVEIVQTHDHGVKVARIFPKDVKKK